MAVAKPRHSGEHPPVLEVTEVRQARRGRHALVILIISTTLTALLFLVLLVLWGPRLAGPGGQTATGQQTSHAPGAPPRPAP